MPTVFLAIARVRDWEAVQRFSEEELLSQVRKLGVARYRLQRNVEDASWLLLIVEASHRDDLDEVICRFHTFFNQDVIESSTWETVAAMDSA